MGPTPTPKPSTLAPLTCLLFLEDTRSLPRGFYNCSFFFLGCSPDKANGSQLWLPIRVTCGALTRCPSLTSERPMSLFREGCGIWALLVCFTSPQVLLLNVQLELRIAALDTMAGSPPSSGFCPKGSSSERPAHNHTVRLPSLPCVFTFSVSIPPGLHHMHI